MKKTIFAIAALCTVLSLSLVANAEHQKHTKKDGSAKMSSMMNDSKHQGKGDGASMDDKKPQGKVDPSQDASSGWETGVGTQSK